MSEKPKAKEAEKNVFSASLNLPQTDFPMRGNLPQTEPEQLAHWQEMGLYQMVRQKSKGKPKRILHDGPPYANGAMHLGHSLNKTLKDIVIRYATMRGYDSPYVPGFDTHGMPIEHAAIRQLKLKRSEITPIALREACEAWARDWIAKQSADFQRLGVLGEWDRPYITLEKHYEAAQLEVFAEFVRKGAIYKGLRPVQWCPTCETALADAEIEYEEKNSPSVYVAFDVAEDKNHVLPACDRPISFVIWTTTPWTLPANMAICLGPSYTYVMLQTASRVMIVAKELQESFVAACGVEVETVLGELKAADLEFILCKHPFANRFSTVILGDHVTLDAGTGCVHTAPGHGQEDFQVARKYNLTVLNPTDSRGRFTAEGGAYEGMKIEEANEQIISDLHASGHLVAQADLVHQYPHCWRCHQPLMFRATEQWFVSVSQFLDNALAEIERVQWFPPSGKTRITNMVRDRGDWCISRQRSWGLPLPVFYCRDCGKELLTPESVLAVRDLFAEQGSNAWYTLEASDILPEGQFACSCGCTEFTKETDIMDVWFDSGSSHAAVLKQWPDLEWPAHVYLEGSDQYRGWFQSSLWTSVITTGRAPYDQVVGCGFTVDAEGRKMSKSLGNGFDPQDIIKQYGADILRLWVLSSDFKGSDVRSSTNQFKQISDTYRKIRNTVRFLLSNLYDFNTNAPDPDYMNIPLLDRMMLDRLYTLQQQVTKAYDEYEFHQVYQSIYHFCTVDLSAFYLDILKDRLYSSLPDDSQRRASQYVLWQMATFLVSALTPALPYTTDAMYAYLPVRGERQAAALLLDWPECPEQWRDDQLAALYAHIVEVRDEINRIVEQARTAKVIGSTLDARIDLFASGETLELLQQYASEWPAWLIASQVQVISMPNSLPEGAVKTELPGLAVRVTLAQGEKCERCWTYSEEVGADAQYPTLCPRCVAVMHSNQQP